MPIGKLGGGQLTLDVFPRAWPVGVSIFTEYYTNSAYPTHSYEIADLAALNLLYRRQFFGVNRMQYFIGGAFGTADTEKAAEKSAAFYFNCN